MKKTGLIKHELVHHLPLTFIGAGISLVAIILLSIFRLLDDVEGISHDIFFILHPGHVILSGIATTSLFMKYGKKRIMVAILVGFFGSLGIATLSDSIMPYVGELLLGLPHSEAHIGFIEEPLTTFGAAFLGVAIGYFYKHNRFPHTGHVLISTWASLFHVLMALGGGISVLQMVGIFLLLALAVWLPCCLSDIIFPLLFSDKKKIHEHHGKEHHTHST